MTPKARVTVLLALLGVLVVGVAAAAERPKPLAHEVHKCMHDRLMEAHPHYRHNRVAQAYGHAAEADDEAPFELRGPSASGARELMSGGGPDRLAGWGEPAGKVPLRVLVDTSALAPGSDAERTCSLAGQMVKRGFPSGPGTTPVCAGSTSTNCWVSCTAGDVFDTTKYNYLVTEAIPAMQAIIGSLLRVTPPVAPNGLLLDAGQTVCGFEGGVGIPSSYRTAPGAAGADFVLFLTARPTVSGVVAWAGYCQEDQYGRTIAGHANWSPAWMSPGGSASARASELSVLVHELTHALGFSAWKFLDMRNPDDPTQARPVSEILETVTRTFANGGQATSTRLITPHLAAFSLLHYNNCAVAGGAWVEDGGGPGSVGSHWESRTGLFDYMIPFITAAPRYTELTAAFFADSGWYHVDFDSPHLRPLAWGRGGGCSFYTGQCAGWGPEYFCAESRPSTCLPDRSAKAACTVTTYASALPLAYRYFSSNPNKGGTSFYTDYCPLPFPVPGGDCALAGNAAGVDTGTTGEHYGGAATDRCFMANIGGPPGQPKAAKCYSTTCDSLAGPVRIKLGGPSSPHELVCDPAGGNHDIAGLGGFSGSIDCPAAATFCPTLLSHTVALIVPPNSTAGLVQEEWDGSSPSASAAAGPLQPRGNPWLRAAVAVALVLAMRAGLVA